MIYKESFKRVGQILTTFQEVRKDDQFYVNASPQGTS